VPLAVVRRAVPNLAPIAPRSAPKVISNGCGFWIAHHREYGSVLFDRVDQQRVPGKGGSNVRLKVVVKEKRAVSAARSPFEVLMKIASRPVVLACLLFLAGIATAALPYYVSVKNTRRRSTAAPPRSPWAPGPP
jgi:hypothetical protein